MTFGQFLGEIKAGRGMAAFERESNRLGVKKVVRGARLGLKAASQILPGKYGEMAGAASTALGKVEGAAETAAVQDCGVVSLQCHTQRGGLGERPSNHVLQSHVQVLQAAKSVVGPDQHLGHPRCTRLDSGSLQLRGE